MRLRNNVSTTKENAVIKTCRTKALPEVLSKEKEHIMQYKTYLKSCQKDKIFPIDSICSNHKSSKMSTPTDEKSFKRKSKLSDFKTPRSSRISNLRKSIQSGWKRMFTKFSPSSEDKLSPLKASQANLQQVIFKSTDSYIDISLWVVNMSEQFFYDNTLLLLNSTKSDIQLMTRYLRHNYKQIDVEFFNNLINISFLGEGSFGSVHRATNASTMKTYAIKYIAPTSEDLVSHCENILEYMAERNSVIRAMNSPFIMAFYLSLQIKNMGGLFLFFEYCVGDLSKFIEDITYKNPAEISRRLDSNEMNIIQDLDQEIGVIETSLMYIFEMFCALDFLVKANIIHQDIKPENLMISETFHLKIGDFGLVYKTRTIHRMTNSLLVNHEEINKTESSNYELLITGTNDYEDFEVKLMELEDQKSPIFDQVMDNTKMFDSPGLLYDEDILIPSFLTDTWAAGVVCIHLLFRGFHLFEPQMICRKILPDVPRRNLNEFLVHVVGRKNIYIRYIYSGLINAGGNDHKQLMQFIASIFRPREARALGFTKKKNMYQYKKKVKQNYIDLDKVEKIKSFQNLQFDSKNIFTLEVPDKIKSMYQRSITTKFLKFEDLLKSLSDRDLNSTEIHMKPGLTINYFH